MNITTADEAKAHLNIVGTDDDVVINAKIAAAEAWIATFIGTALDDAEAFPDGLPAPLKEATLQLVGHLYANREASLVGVSADLLPLGIFDLMQPYRIWVFGE